MAAQVLVSRCLLGETVRYDGASSGRYSQLVAWQEQGLIVPLCPEVAGGLPTPRAPAEIVGGQGIEVWAGLSAVICKDGSDVSAAFLAGAQQAVALARRYGLRMAVLKSRSPSCGNQTTYDGSFSGRLAAGEGVTVAALRRIGVAVFSELELAAAQAYLQRIR